MQICRRVFRNNGPLILASGSPRRKSMLAELGLDFVVQVSQVDELVKPGDDPEKFVKRVAKEKAMAVAIDHVDAWVLAADTVVVKNGQILGKPAGLNESVTMLKSLAGKMHEVWTGFCLVNHRANILVCRAGRTKVRFIDWHEELFLAYANTGDSLDKAGAYGIQGAGGVLVQDIQGSYSNVVGLPIAEVLREMLRLGVVCCHDGTSV